MRELRKDAAFLGAARDADVGRARAERRAVARGNLAFMEAQEADMKSGGQVRGAASSCFAQALSLLKEGTCDGPLALRSNL